MRIALLYLLFTLFCINGLWTAEQVPTPNVQAQPLNKQHQVFDNILVEIVQTNGVDYQNLKNKHSEKLQLYQRQLATASVPKQSADKMAFYINAYNALTLALVLQHLPDDSKTWAKWSVRKVDGFWTDYQFELAGTWLSLDDIEHKILRPMGDPRIHFAVNCASESCPALRNRAYLGSKLEQQLKEQEQMFLASSSHFRIEQRRLYLNPILSWFAKDFEKYGGVRAYLIKHSPQAAVQKHLKDKGPLKYFSYDWPLNMVPDK